MTYKGHSIEVVTTKGLPDPKHRYWEKYTFRIDGQVDWSCYPDKKSAMTNAKDMVDRRQKAKYD